MTIKTLKEKFQGEYFEFLELLKAGKIEPVKRFIYKRQHLFTTENLGDIMEQLIYIFNLKP